MESSATDAEFEQPRNSLPKSEDDGDWGELFAVVDGGGWTEAQEAQTGGGPQ